MQVSQSDSAEIEHMTELIDTSLGTIVGTEVSKAANEHYYVLMYKIRLNCKLSQLTTLCF